MPLAISTSASGASATGALGPVEGSVAAATWGAASWVVVIGGSWRTRDGTGTGQRARRHRPVASPVHVPTPAAVGETSHRRRVDAGNRRVEARGASAAVKGDLQVGSKEIGIVFGFRPSAPR